MTLKPLNIERDHWYLTRDGTKVRVVCVDAPGGWPVIGVFANGNVTLWEKDGINPNDEDDDLIAEVRVPREWTLTRQGPHAITTVGGPDLEVVEVVRVREVLDD